MNRKIFFFILMAVWFFMIASYTAFKEYSLNSGATVMLKLVPVDPRDLFRGDYVILNYEISSRSKEQRVLDSFDNKDSVYSGKTVFVMLIPNGKYYRAGDIYTSKPSKGLFIRGKVEVNNFSFELEDFKNFTIIYNIENYFVPEGEGLIIENERNRSNVSAEVKINTYGMASLKNLYINDTKVDFKNRNEKNN